MSVKETINIYTQRVNNSFDKMAKLKLLKKLILEPFEKNKKLSSIANKHNNIGITLLNKSVVNSKSKLQQEEFHKYLMNKSFEKIKEKFFVNRIFVENLKSGVI